MEKLELSSNAVVLPVSGEVIRVATILMDSHDSMLITLSDKDAKIHDIWISKAFVDASDAKHILFVGNIVTINCEYRVKDVTQYTDDAGNLEYHKSDSVVGLAVYNAALIELSRMVGMSNAMMLNQELTRMRKEHEGIKVVAIKANVDVKDRTSLEADITSLTKRMVGAPDAFKEVYAARIEVLQNILKDLK